MIFRCLIVALVAVAFHPGQAFAQDMLPAPSDQTERDACMKEFAPLRAEAYERGKLIKVASERHVPPDEACKLLVNFGRSEIDMIKYVGANSTRCGIPSQIADQLRAGYKNTEAALVKVCMAAQREQRRGPTGPVGDFDDIGAPPLVR